MFIATASFSLDASASASPRPGESICAAVVLTDTQMAFELGRAGGEPKSELLANQPYPVPMW
jgi:hypothetical protein